MKVIGAARFGELCLSPSNHPDPDGSAVTRRGWLAAHLMPYGAPKQDLTGSLRYRIEVGGDIPSSSLLLDAGAQRLCP